MARFTWIFAAVVFLLVFVVRVLDAEFENDHFVHLSRAAQIVRGEIPVRDFFDPGVFLHYYVSAAGLAIWGHQLLSEALITAFFIAAGTAITFVLATTASGSLAGGFCAAACAFLTIPRLYNYPKIFLYPLAAAGMWAYAARPGFRRLAVLAVITVLAFLFRHDHGLYVGLGVGALLLFQHWGESRQMLRHLSAFALMCALLVTPYAAFLLWTGHARSFVSNLVWATGEVSRQVRPAGGSFAVDSWTPFMVESPRQPTIQVRWAPSVDAAQRAEAERRHDLSDGEWLGGRTWDYRPGAVDAGSVRRLVLDPQVEDTHGIDRRAFTVEESRFARMRRRVWLFRVQPLPGVLRQENAVAWLWGVTKYLPLVALIMLLAGRRRGTIQSPTLVWAGALSVLCLIIGRTLVRNSPESRLADVAAPMAVLASFVFGEWIRRCRRPAATSDEGAGDDRRPARPFGRVMLAGERVLMIGIVGLSLLAVLGLEDIRDTFQRIGLLNGPDAVTRHAAEMWSSLRGRPLDSYAPEGSVGSQRLARYLAECTNPGDRFFVTWYAPQLYFYADRAFAAGHLSLGRRWYTSIKDQALAIARLRSQRVPLVLLDPGEEAMLSRDYPLIADYVRTHYRFGGESRFGGHRMVRVLASRDVPVTREVSILGVTLPCFTPAPAAGISQQ